MKKKSSWIILIVALLIITNTGTFYISNNLAALRFSKLDVSKFSKLYEIRDLLYKYYDGNIDDKVLEMGAVKGMTAALKDPYTVFMDSSDYQSFSSELSGSFTGVGLQVENKSSKVVVVAPIDNSPAKKAGIITGDVIEKIDGNDISGKALNEVVSMIRGKADTSVKINFFREGKGNFDVTLKRQSIVLDSVKGEMLDNNIGYIQISGFDANTDELFNKKLSELVDKNMKGLIIDLRGNGGGYLKTCVNIASNFVENGKTIVYTVDKYNNKDVEKSKGGIWVGKPLVVLTDQGTASASEVFSGAVRDYKAATLVGTTTFGKGIVQITIPDKSDGTALKVTISKYYSPNGENIHKKGIKPDIEVAYPKELQGKTYDRSADPQFQKAFQVIKDKVK